MTDPDLFAARAAYRALSADELVRLRRAFALDMQQAVTDEHWTVVEFCERRMLVIDSILGHRRDDDAQSN